MSLQHVTRRGSELLIRRSAARLRQSRLDLPTDNEIGFTVCRLPSGKLTHGPVTSGTPVSVNIDVSCPSGSTPEALWHTHPGGVAYPSPTDVMSTRRMKLKHLCITVPDTGETRCFRVRR